MQSNILDRTDRPAGGPVSRVLRRESGRWWWLPLAAGIAWFVIAWLVLRADATSLATVGVLVGVTFLIAAVNETVLAQLMTGGWKVAQYVLAFVFLIGALWSFVRPIDTTFALASVLGLILFLQGAYAVVAGFALRDVSPFWWVELLSGLLITALGIWVSVSDQVWDLRNRAVFILLWVGIMALFRGISDLVLAFSALYYAKRGGTVERAAVDAIFPPVPAQERRPSDDVTQSGRPPATSAARA
jgi:uncharacterized membrane protein HdeD (DUF308 family)